MKIKKSILIALLSIALLTSAYATNVEVEIVGTEISTTELIFSINVNEVTDFDTTDFTINYDSSTLELVSVESGTVTVGGDINLNKETNKVLLNMPGTDGVSGSGSITEIKFNVIGTGDKSISLSDFNIGDRFGSVIEISSVDYVGDFATAQEAPEQDDQSGQANDSKEGSSALLYSVIAIVALILIVGGFLLWSKFKKPKPELPIQQAPPVQQPPATQPQQPAQPQPAPADQTQQQPDQLIQ